MEYKSINEFAEYINELVSGKKPNWEMHLGRIYGAYERECDEIKKEAEVEDVIHKRKGLISHKIHKITDEMYIVEYNKDIFNDGKKNWFTPFYNTSQEKILKDVVYETFDKALIALICVKNNCEDAAPYIYKMLGMEDGD